VRNEIEMKGDKLILRLKEEKKWARWTMVHRASSRCLGYYWPGKCRRVQMTPGARKTMKILRASFNG
jgi:hypothetical protein